MIKFIYPEGAMPIEADEVFNLLPSHIKNQSELNEWEEYNILLGYNWGVRQLKKEILSFDFLIKLHKRMFDKTWKWAGKFRKCQTNIGVESAYIAVSVKNLIDDTKFQIENLIYDIDEICYRFHHRLVLIHPFPNGNGRHSRLMTDLILMQMGKRVFSWGSKNLVSDLKSRKIYLQALRAADKNLYEKLSIFVRS